MKRKNLFKLLLIVGLAMLSLLGCGAEPHMNGETESSVWTTWPQLNYGTMEYEKLTVQPWDSGRFAALSENKTAETQMGYYFLHGSLLYYADKSDLSTWVPVCNRPDCDHIVDADCNAQIGVSSFVIKNGRIYTVEMLGSHPELYQTKAPGAMGILSRAMDGTDLRLEYVNESMFATSKGGGLTHCRFTQEHWIYGSTQLNADGSYSLQCYRITDSGAEILVDERLESIDGIKPSSFKRQQSAVLGEPTFNSYGLGDEHYMECRYRDGQLHFVDLTDYYEDGRYLSGDYLRMFRQNDGYYDVDLTTKEEVKVADARLKNSECWMLLPNCIIESTVFYSVYDQRPEGENHRMELFDGESWRTVQLPEELQQPVGRKFLSPRYVSSDSIFFICTEETAVHLYRIPIEDGELTLEYCGRIK